jgi:hypothetical protein
MLSAAPAIPIGLWDYAAQYAVRLLNLSVTSALPEGTTPEMKLLEHMGVVNTTPNLHNLRQFGTKGWINLPYQTRV